MAEWRNWQTHQTQNLAFFTERVGSTPTSATISNAEGILYGLPELFILLVLLPVTLAGLAFWVWMLVDCATNEPSVGNDKLVWIIIIVFTQIIGALIYYFVRHCKRLEEDRVRNLCASLPTHPAFAANPRAAGGSMPDPPAAFRPSGIPRNS